MKTTWFIGISATLALAGGLLAETVTTLHRFAGQPNDAGYPHGVLAIDAKGNLYGGSSYGGNGPCMNGRKNVMSGCGAIFEVSPPASAGGAWTESILYSFQDGLDGCCVGTSLVVGPDGALYGETEGGGTAGQGTVFRLAPPATAGGAWTESVLYSFSGDEQGELTGLSVDGNGVLYIVDPQTGTNNGGVIFTLSPPASAGGAWTRTDLYSFGAAGSGDGVAPSSPVVVSSGSVLYGVTPQGGANGTGTVFKLTPPASAGGSWTETVLYSFAGAADGSYPLSLSLGKNGVLFGTMLLGGSHNHGGVFSLTPPSSPGGAWTEAVLTNYRTQSQSLDPPVPCKNDGSICATNVGALGTVFELTPPPAPGGAWTETFLHRFQKSPSKGEPIAPNGVALGPDGMLYGTTFFGGNRACPYGCGRVYQLAP